MRIWSEFLTEDDLDRCAARVRDEHPGVDIYVSDAAELYEGERTRRLDRVHLRSWNGTRHSNTGVRGAGTEMAASWTEWGWWLAEVFELDPAARANDYRGAEDFHRQTGHRFRATRTPRERQVRRMLTALDRTR